MIADPGSTRRLTWRGSTFTSPAIEAAASSPVNAITAMGKAKARLDHVGAVPRWMAAVSRPG